jgi:DNA polymerase II
LCSCCTNRSVPEANYNICEKRRGLIPQTLRPLLERRKQYKLVMRQRADAGKRETYNAMQTAIKWMLVSCFGYLGHRNARFGRIEAHEAVTAYGREKLLRAKELAEAAGYRVLHALTDSLWLARTDLTEAEVVGVCEVISRATQVEMSCEGIYRWVVFLPSKVKSQRPVATRYYGVFSDGRLKLRGLACRRSDTPLFIKDVQIEMLEVLAEARSAGERRRLIERAKTILEKRIRELQQGRVDPRRLMLRRTLTKEVANYKTETRTAAAARQLESAGVKVHPGEHVRYLVTSAGAKEKARRVRAEELASRSKYDAAEYVKLLKAAAAEVLWELPSLD